MPELADYKIIFPEPQLSELAVPSNRNLYLSRFVRFSNLLAQLQLETPIQIPDPAGLEKSRSNQVLIERATSFQIASLQRQMLGEISGRNIGYNDSYLNFMQQPDIYGPDFDISSAQVSYPGGKVMNSFIRQQIMSQLYMPDNMNALGAESNSFSQFYDDGNVKAEALLESGFLRFILYAAEGWNLNPALRRWADSLVFYLDGGQEKISGTSSGTLPDGSTYRSISEIYPEQKSRLIEIFGNDRLNQTASLLVYHDQIGFSAELHRQTRSAGKLTIDRYQTRVEDLAAPALNLIQQAGMPDAWESRTTLSQGESTNCTFTGHSTGLSKLSLEYVAGKVTSINFDGITYAPQALREGMGCHFLQLKGGRYLSLMLGNGGLIESADLIY